MPQRYFLEFSYKGTNYYGYQIQPEQTSVQEVLEKALSTIINQPIELTGASRTDTGVHALQSFAHFDGPKKLPEAFVHRINRMLPGDVAIRGVHAVEAEAHARFDATSRSYEYWLYFEKNPFREKLGFFYQLGDLDIGVMNRAASMLLQYKDFDSFCKSNTQVKTKVCHLTRSEWVHDDRAGDLVYHVTADRFLRGMVRGLVATMLLVGRGKLTIEGFQLVIEGKDNQLADFSAPPEGLYLTEIKYPYKLGAL